MKETIFSKIINKEVPAEIIYEDDLAIAFKDVNPKAPAHLLVIPKKVVSSLSAAQGSDTNLLGHCLQVCKKVAEQVGIEEGGYRVVTNIGEDGGQSVFHLHFHVLGGRSLQWPPG